MYQECLLLLSLVLNTLSAAHVKKKAEKRIAQPYTPLPDIIQDYCPPISSHIPDILLGLIGFKYLLYDTDQFIEVERNINCFLICSLFRSIFIHATILPTCVKPIHTITPVEINHIQFNHSIAYICSIYSKLFHSTHDLMYSGHTLVFMFLGKY